MSPVKAKMRPSQRSHIATRGLCRSKAAHRQLIDQIDRHTGVSQRWECHAFNLNLHVERVKLRTPDASFPFVKAGIAWLGSLDVGFGDHLGRSRGDSLHLRVAVASQVAIPQFPNQSFLFLDFCFGIYYSEQ